MTDEIYCIKSVDRKCKHTECPRNLKGFYSLFLNLAEFNCEEELGEKDDNR